MLGIDVHCHLEYMDAQNVVKQAREKMRAIITSVADIKHFEQIKKICEEHSDFVFMTAGLHPTKMYPNSDVNEYINSIRTSNVVGIGETGLDYHYITDEKEKEKSKKLFLSFIDLANEMNLPLVIHARNAMQDALEILKHADTPVVMHFFSGNAEELRECLDRNYFISFTTMICKSKRYKKLAKKTPLENMLLETDSPWLDPFSKELNNKPWNIYESAKKIAEILDISEEDVLERTQNNAIKVFRLWSN